MIELTFLNKGYAQRISAQAWPYLSVEPTFSFFSRNPQAYKVDWSTYDGKTVQVNKV